MSTIVLAVVIGAAFGAALDRIGATNPGYIIRMLNLTNMHLAKTILLAIGVSAILLFGGLLSGLIDPGHMSVKTAYLGVFVGGVLLGTGFAVVGYCPGTGLGAMATGRKDALFFVFGGLVGAGIYMAKYSSVKATGILAKIAGGKTTLGAVAGTKYTALFPTISGEALGIGLGVLLILVAIIIPARIIGSKGKSATT